MKDNEEKKNYFHFEKLTELFLDEDRYFKIPPLVLFALGIYIAYWTVISIINFDQANANVYDLGLAYISIWSVTHLSFASHALLIKAIKQGGAFLIFPLQYGGFYALLIFQSFFLGLGSIFIYFIGRELLKDYKISAFISVLYLLYFPLYGLNWFSFHFQSLFPTFFLMGYYLFLKSKWKLASISFLVAGMMRFPYEIFPLLFWLIVFFSKKSQLNKQPGRTIVILNIIMFSTLLIIGFFVLGIIGLQTHATSNFNPSIGIYNKLLTLFLIFSPLLFLPILSRRWAFFIVPFVLLMFFTNNPIYQFPYVFQLQYSASYIVFVFLGFIEVISLQPIQNISDRHDSRISDTRLRYILVNLKKRIYDKRSSIVRISFVILIVASLAYQFMVPLEQINSYSRSNLLSNSNVSINAQLTEISSLVPINNTNVLLQNNLPQFLETHPQPNLIVPGFVGPTITISDIRNNTFPFLTTGHPSTVRIDYVLADIADPTMYQSSLNPGYPSMNKIIIIFLNSGYYGILAQSTAFVLLERNYHGPVKLLNPLSYEFSNSDFSSEPLLSDGFVLAPGNYTMTINANQPLNWITSLDLLGNCYLTSQFLSIVNVTFPSGVGSSYTLHFTVPEITPNVHAYLVESTNTTAQIQFMITIKQNASFS